ncbi:DUF7946 domain-containing protein [Paracoccus sp. (in: a-proteobacteria)]|uniref:DUF7946 domain-containing protein n=1 Tax=Paracoccus sp. TaxID=267 RepID=UPI00405958A5
MEVTTFRLHYEGREADKNRLLAYDGVESIDGFSWALSVVLGYAVTGSIRRRGDPSAAIRLYLMPSKQGSYISDLAVYVTQPENKFLTSILGTVTISALTTYLVAIVNRVFLSAVGKSALGLEKGTRYLRKLDSGDLEELSRRIEPPLTRAHAVVGRSADQITLASKRTPLLTFDESTKKYLESQIEVEPITIYSNVSAFNALWSTGRLYDRQVGRTVPFKIQDNALEGTGAAISESLMRYTKGWPAEIKIVARREVAGDNHIKRYHISAAEPIDPNDLI